MKLKPNYGTLYPMHHDKSIWAIEKPSKNPFGPLVSPAPKPIISPKPITLEIAKLKPVNFIPNLPTHD